MRLAVSDVATGQILAAIILLGTLVGWTPFLLATARKRERRGTRARREPAAWVEIMWPLGTLAIQFWTVGVLLAPSWFYAWPQPWPFVVDHALQFAGFVVWAAAGLLAVWAGRTLGRYMTPEIRVEEGHRLVQEGPYRRIRHPTYTANVTMAIGVGLAFLHPVLLVLAGLMAIAARHRALLEEDLLRSPEAFGPEYVAYMAKTGRFLPKFSERPEG